MLDTPTMPNLMNWTNSGVLRRRDAGAVRCWTACCGAVRWKASANRMNDRLSCGLGRSIEDVRQSVGPTASLRQQGTRCRNTTPHPHPAQRGGPRLQRGGARRGVRARAPARPSPTSSSSSCSSTTAAPTARPSCSTASPRGDPRVRVIHLSRNFGHQAALTAGLEHAVGDVVAMIDADLQDPPELIPEMVAQWSQGADVVYAVRQQREGETAFKLATASWFYKLFDKLAQVDLEPNSRRLPPARPARAERAAGDDRALALPARDDGVGRLQPDRRLLRARRAPRRRDQVHAAQDAALLARRDHLLLAPAPAAGHLRRACSPPAWRSSRSRS